MLHFQISIYNLFRIRYKNNYNFFIIALVLFNKLQGKASSSETMSSSFGEGKEENEQEEGAIMDDTLESLESNSFLPHWLFEAGDHMIFVIHQCADLKVSCKVGDFGLIVEWKLEEPSDKLLAEWGLDLRHAHKMIGELAGEFFIPCSKRLVTNIRLVEKVDNPRYKVIKVLMQSSDEDNQMI